MRKSVLDEKKKRNSSIPMSAHVNHFQTKHIIKYLNSFLPNLELLKNTTSFTPFKKERYYFTTNGILTLIM